ncbi:MAG: hypothetical protein DMF88_12775, partial [Acidobacteria bacterium]
MLAELAGMGYATVEESARAIIAERGQPQTSEGSSSIAGSSMRLACFTRSRRCPRPSCKPRSLRTHSIRQSCFCNPGRRSTPPTRSVIIARAAAFFTRCRVFPFGSERSMSCGFLGKASHPPRGSGSPSEHDCGRYDGPGCRRGGADGGARLARGPR